MQTNSNTIEGIQSSLFTVTAMKPIVAPTASISSRKNMINSIKPVVHRAAPKISMGLQNESFSKAAAGKSDFSLGGKSLQVRSNSSDKKI